MVTYGIEGSALKQWNPGTRGFALIAVKYLVGESGAVTDDMINGTDTVRLQQVPRLWPALRLTGRAKCRP